MRLLKSSVAGFASYSSLDFDFSNQGLTLIHGVNGSGKSSICDMVPWLLFGKTAKGGGVNEVLNWASDIATSGNIEVDTAPGTILKVTRVRNKTGYKEFYFQVNEGAPVRGKDATETQALLDAALGMSFDTYAAASYMHEFSTLSGFFKASVKDRRQLCEELTDLTFIVDLLKKASQTKLYVSTQVQEAQQTVQAHTSRLGSLKELAKQCEHNLLNVESTTNRLRAQFELSTASKIHSAEGQLAALRTKTHNSNCHVCGSEVTNDNYLAWLHREMDKVETQLTELRQIKFNEVILTDVTTEGRLVGIRTDIVSIQQSLTEAQAQLAALLTRRADLETLEELIRYVKKLKVSGTISNVESRTNQYLSDHFDAEVKVELVVKDDDKLETIIKRNGYECSYSQLSKGQRQLLKLCFGVAVMETVSNAKGLNITSLFFDEALDGFDDNFKRKAFDLFQKLATKYETILVVEHSSELKTLFTNQYKVAIVDGKSSVTHNS